MIIVAFLLIIVSQLVFLSSQMLRATRSLFKSFTTPSEARACLLRVMNGHPDPPSVGLLTAIKLGLFNRVAHGLLWPLSAGYFENIYGDLSVGSIAALRFVSNAIDQKDKNAIRSCTDNELGDTLVNAIEMAKEEDDKDGGTISSNFHSIPESATISAHSIRLCCWWGAVRGDDVKQVNAVDWFGQKIILEPDEDLRAGYRQGRSMLFKALLRGLTVRAEVGLDVMRDVHTLEQHLLDFEMSLIPHPDLATDFRPTGTPHAPPPSEVSFETTEWKLVDVNKILGGNPPLRV